MGRLTPQVKSSRENCPRRKSKIMIHVNREKAGCYLKCIFCKGHFDHALAFFVLIAHKLNIDEVSKEL